MPDFSRVLHLGLTVRDMHQSAEWYMRVLGFVFVKEFTVAPGEVGYPRILVMHPGSGFLIGLYSHPNRSGDLFSPFRTGLDHFALEVGTRDELDGWIKHLDQLGVDHSPVRDLGHSCFVSVNDPDGIQLELWFTVTPHVASEA